MLMDEVINSSIKDRANFMFPLPATDEVNPNVKYTTALWMMSRKIANFVQFLIMEVDFCAGERDRMKAGAEF